MTMFVVRQQDTPQKIMDTLRRQTLGRQIRGIMETGLRNLLEIERGRLRRQMEAWERLREGLGEPSEDPGKRGFLIFHISEGPPAGP